MRDIINELPSIRITKSGAKPPPLHIPPDALEYLPDAAAGRGARGTAYPHCSRRRVRHATLLHCGQRTAMPLNGQYKPGRLRF